MTKLKNKDKDLKILLAVNVWKAHSKNFNEMTRSTASIDQFTKHAKFTIKSNGEFLLKKIKYSVFNT